MTLRPFITCTRCKGSGNSEPCALLLPAPWWRPPGCRMCGGRGYVYAEPVTEYTPGAVAS